MERNARKLERFRLGSAEMNADQRRAMRAALEYAREGGDAELWELVTDIGAAIGRAVQKRQNNRKTEPRRRRLVGAQMPILEADRCKACAQLLGISQYRFVVEALSRECRMVEARHGLAWNGNRHRTVTVE